MLVNGEIPIPEFPSAYSYSKSEWSVRVQLAACYRIFDLLGWTELIFNHITVRVPDTQDEFFINPYGLHYSEVTAHNLVKINIQGQKLEDSPWSVNPAGFIIHSAIHAARHDVLCIAHTHTNSGMAIACQQAGLRSDNFYSAGLHSKVAYHDFEGITVNPEEKQRLVTNLGDKNFLILRNHGLLTCGQSIPAAFMNLWILQRACDVQMLTDSTQQPIQMIQESVYRFMDQAITVQTKGYQWGQLEFAAMMRQIKSDYY